jgi:TonB family protein
MYFDFGDYRPDTPRLESAISRREGVLLSVIGHLALFGLLIWISTLPIVQQAEAARLAALERRRLEAERLRDEARFVFVQPRIDRPSPAPPPRAELSDRDRVARTIERAPDPRNRLPFMRGNSSERVEAEPAARARGERHDAQPSPAEAAGTARTDGGERSPASPDDTGGRTAFLRPQTAPAGGRAGSLGEALRNLERYVQEEHFDNPQGGAGAYGPSIQFDSKGVEFGPWIRRFVAQIKRNWFIPYAAMSFRGHVVLTFNVHKDGRISDLAIVQPSAIEAFNTAAYNALLASNPTQPLPPEYPADRAFFTVTFYYNESPPSQ